MIWSELRILGQQYVTEESDVTYARTFIQDNVGCGMLEFKFEKDAEFVIKKLSGKRIKGHQDRLKVYKKTSLEMDTK